MALTEDDIEHMTIIIENKVLSLKESLQKEITTIRLEQSERSGALPHWISWKKNVDKELSELKFRAEEEKVRWAKLTGIAAVISTLLSAASSIAISVIRENMTN